MKQFFTRFFAMAVLVTSTLSLNAQQLPDPGFEDWSGAKFDGNIQPKSWHASNVSQVGQSYNFITRETGRSGYAAKVANTFCGLGSIGQTSPGYLTLGSPWQYLPSITQLSSATGGTDGGISFTYRPDSMYVWIKRTGSKVGSEHYSVLFYSWSGTSKGTSYKANTANSCTSTSHTDEESDIRQAMDANTCGTPTKANQVAEGFFFEMKEHSSWTQIKVPIYYFNDDAPTKCNVIFSSSGYPNFRNSNNINDGNAIYVDDVELIYSSKIQQLYIGGKVWNGFDPNSTEEQVYSVGKTTVVPEVYAMRGAGTISNIKGTKVTLPGRKLSGDEISITYGQVDGTPTVITVKAGDGSSTTTYKIKMVQEKSNNANLNSILVNGEPISGYNPQLGTYNVALPYGTTATPVVTYVKAEDEQTVSVTQATSPTGKATLVVTAADGKAKKTYTINFSVAQLSDNTLKSIKVNDEEIPGFTPTLTTYRVELPLGTTTMPKVEAVSNYPAGEQTIKYEAPDKIDGGQYKVSVTTPGNQTAKVYKLNFKITASTYSKLRDLKMGDYITDFDPDKTTYYVSFPMGVTELPEITYEKGDAYQTVVIDKGGVDGTTYITVTAASGAVTVYRIVCSIEKSDVSYLNNIYLDGVALDGFDSYTYKYTVNLPIGTTSLPTITVDKGDQYEEVQINYGGLNAVTRIFVTAGDGSRTLYEITFTVEVANVSTLDMISVGGQPIEGFSPNQTEYSIALPQGTTELPEVTCQTHDAWQTVTVRSNGVNGDYKITVRSQAGTSTTYVLHFSVQTSSNTSLAAVYLDGVAYADYDPSVMEYEITMPAGVSQVPNITYDKGDASQKVVSTLEGTTYTIRVISESGASVAYIFRFVIQKSENAFLNMIYLDGVALAGFDKQTLIYNVVLTGTICPTVSVDKDPTQQVTITTPVSTGEARIVVTPESGAPNTYIINFTSSVLPQLAAIYADGVRLADYNPAVYEYDVNYSSTFPAITFDKVDANQQVTVVSNAETMRLYVEAGGDSKVYTLTFVQTPASDASLRSISANGVQLEGFDSNTLNYTYQLAGDELPLITYERNDPDQYVVAGMSSQYVYSLVVNAPNGNSKTYSIRFITNASDVIGLVSIKLGGEDVTELFDENNHLERTIDKGAELPELTYTTAEGQSVVGAQTSPLDQQLIVLAENGDTATYSVHYTELTETNALLKDIRLYIGERWQSIEGFNKNTYAYNVELPWRTTTAPCLWTVSDRPNQVVTITYGAANGTTTVHVVAEDNQQQDYTITFAVAKSANTKLASLTIDGDEQDVNTTDYTFTLPFGSIKPYDVQYERAEPEQQIEYVDAPIGGVTKIIVTAENGDKRTYSIRYTIEQPQGENILKEIHYTYTNAADETVDGVLVPVKGNNDVNLPFGSKSFTVTQVVKNYEEQAVVFYNGGIRRGAKLIVSANKEKLNDVTYTVTPVMPEFDTMGKLKSLKFKGAEVPNFKPYVYNYMVNVTAQPTAADFTYETYNGETVTPSAINATKKQITFKVDGGETYSVCWFYEHDNMYQKDGQWYSYLDFSSDRWVQSAKKTGYKPYNWNVPADYADKKDYVINLGITKISFTYSTGKEVMMGGENGALLSTMRGASLNSSVPGMMSLNANMSVTLETSGNSTFRMQGDKSTGVVFRNTPEQFALDYNPLAVSGDITKWTWQLLMSNGSTTASTDYDGSFSPLNTKKTAIKDINYGSIGKVSRYTLLIKAADKPTPSSSTAKCYNGGTISESSLIVQNLRFIYNSELTAATVNGKATTKSGNTFTYTLADGEDIVGVPALKFTGAVHDQMQVIRWKNNGEWSNGELTALVTNFGENSTDSTVYLVVLKRAAVTTLDYTASFGTYGTTVSNDTTYVNMPYATTALPDLNIIPASIHQKFSVQKNGNAIEVTVSAEDGSSKTDIYVFRDVRTSQATLDGITGATLTPVFDPATAEYTITGQNKPVLGFVKGEEGTLNQTVDMKEDGNRYTFVVTAEDGISQQTYTVDFTPTAETTYGKLTGISRNGEVLTTFAEETYAYELRESENVAFSRKYAADAVVQTITDDSLTITLTGSDEMHTYTITYPQEPSSNASLGGILINGNPYADFDPMQTDYTYETDEPVKVEFVAGEDVQKITITMSNPATAPQRVAAARTYVSVFTIVVTAEDGTQKTYTFTLRPESSDITALAGISVNGALLADFYPDKLNYTYTIPTTSPKVAEPALPAVGYTLGQESQSVAIDPATELGKTTVITVTAENGTSVREYKLTINAEPSHSAELLNILVNGDSVNGFRPARTFYSMQVFGDEVNVDYTTADRFQTVAVSDTEEGKLLTVTAQDGTTVREYEIEVWRAAKSNNANLAAILLDGKSLTAYAEENDIEVDPFKEKTYTYRIPLAKDAQLPDISATLQETAQTVEILSSGLIKTLRVTAEDGTTQNDYRLIFVVEQSSNTALSAILLNGDTLDAYIPTQYTYSIALPVGVRTVPSVDFIKAETEQSVTTERSSDGMQTDIHVTAEDGTVDTYSIRFAFTYSDADTLTAIYADNQLIEGFTPSKDYYFYLLPKGVRMQPIMDYDQADPYQTVITDTITKGLQTTYRFTVLSERYTETAGTGNKSIYTVIYEIQASDVDTLRQIMLDNHPLEGFNPLQNDYTITLPYGTTSIPAVNCELGDMYQDTTIIRTDNEVRIIVTAENGTQRIYNLHFDIAKSNNALLKAIYVGGVAVDPFDPESEMVNVNLPYGTTAIPLITYEKGDFNQVVEIGEFFGIYGITVKAADGVTVHTYVLNFIYAKSPEAHLNGITIGDEPLAEFQSDLFEYNVTLPYGTTELPTVGYVLTDTTAVADVQTADNVVTISVVSQDENNYLDYVVIFTIEGCPINWLDDLMVGGQTIEGFDKDSTIYTIAYPVGTDESAFVHAADITYVAGDSTEVIEVSEENNSIYVNVTAENGEVRVYAINQVIRLSDNSLLSDITLNGVSLANFNDSTYEYEYLLLEGETMPMVEAVAQDSLAEVSVTPGAVGEATLIYCTAQDGTETIYKVLFRVSSINTALEARSTDVLFKQIGGTDQFAAYSIRNNTSIAIFDHYGHLMFDQPLPVCNPNEVTVATDPNGREIVTDAHGDGAFFTIPVHGQVFFYMFYSNNQRICSGKFMVQ